MTAELLRRARAGDHRAYAEMVEPHRGELQRHCYRMLGNLQDAEDVLQEALVAAWVGLAGFEGRSSVRTWLFRIVTNRCLNALRSSTKGRSETTGVPWLQPYPDHLLESRPDPEPGPEARYDSREAISLAFVTAVQLLPPNQRAALLLRDVLGYRAAETAELLGSTEDAVTSALKRARATIATGKPAPDIDVERELVDRFVAAFTGSDVDALIALMTDDVWLRMPPLPFEYRGIAAAREFLTTIEAHRNNVARMVPTRANGHPAWGEYVADPVTGGLHLTGIVVVALAGDRICEITHFESALGASLGLPRTLG